MKLRPLEKIRNWITERYIWVEWNHPEFMDDSERLNKLIKAELELAE